MRNTKTLEDRVRGVKTLKELNALVEPAPLPALPDVLREKVAQIVAEEQRLALMRGALIDGWCYAQGIDPARASYDVVTGIVTVREEGND